MYQPDIPQNAALMRLAACCVPLEVIEPCGLLINRHLRRAGMDYADMATVTRHDPGTPFCARCRVGSFC